MNPIDKFIEVFNTPYTFKEEEEIQFKEAGEAFIRKIGEILDAEVVNICYTPMGIMDRGYIRGFIKKNRRIVFVFITDNPPRKTRFPFPIVYRRVKHENDCYGGSTNNYARVDKESIGEMIDNIRQILSK